MTSRKKLKQVDEVASFVSKLNFRSRTMLAEQTHKYFRQSRATLNFPSRCLMSKLNDVISTRQLYILMILIEILFYCLSSMSLMVDISQQ